MQEITERAWIFHQSREPDSAGERPVSATSILAATFAADQRVLAAVQGAGLNLDLWLDLVRAPELPDRDMTPAKIVDYPVGDEAILALDRYVVTYRDRPLDSPGLAICILETITGAGRQALRDASLDLEAAVAALKRLIHLAAADAHFGLVPASALTQFELSETARRLLRSAQTIAADYSAPLTTSVVIATVCQMRNEDTSTVGALGRHIAGVTPLEEIDKRIHEWMLWYRPAESGLVTKQLIDAINQAETFALLATELRVIHGRHLLAALLTIPEDTNAGVNDILRWLGARRAEVLRFLYDDVEGMIRRQVLGDDLTAWREIMSGSGRAGDILTPRHLVASVSTDVSDGADLLDIGRDIRSFATLIAAKNPITPLSVGVFGNWVRAKASS